MLKLFSLLLLACACSASTVIQAGDIGVEYVGQSGQIKLYMQDDPSDWIKIKWAKIEEIDEDGKKVQAINNFASQDFTWVLTSPVWFDTVDGVQTNATEVTLRSTLDVKGNECEFNVYTYVFGVDTEVFVPGNGNTTFNKTVTVTENAVKFAVEIIGWPFEAETNRLSFGASLTEGGGGDIGETEEQDDGQVSSIGSGRIYLEETAVINRGLNSSEFVDIESSIDDNDITWIFPYFSDNLYYDPTLELDGSGGDDGDGAIKASYLTAIFASILMSVVVALW